MAELEASMNKNDNKSITDLDVDSLVNCTSNLSIQDISNMAMTCKFFRYTSYSDSIWHRLFREKWPELELGQQPPGTSVRDAYLSRHAAVQGFSFVDPLVADWYTDYRNFSHVLLAKNQIIISQGSVVHLLKVDDIVDGKDCLVSLRDHRARITCMRLYPINDTSFVRSEAQNDDNILITSSSDRSIRLWWKGSCIRCFRGHRGPVSVLSDKLLGDDGNKILASGGDDGTVRLWSLNSSGKRDQHALNATLHGHEKPVKLLSVAGHKTSLLISVATDAKLISVATDSKIRVWDTIMASTSPTSSCVGMTSVPGFPVGVKCFESLLYVAAGHSVHAIDLRTMQKAFAAVCSSDLYSFEMQHSSSLICAGGGRRAFLWDMRKIHGGSRSDPIMEMEGHTGIVTQVHMDPYKIVTRCPADAYTNIWEAETGHFINSLSCAPETSNPKVRCNAMAIDGGRIFTASSGETGILRFMDFNNASKFWNSNSCSDSDYDEDTYYM